ncbi:hypothetical protein TNCV_2261501 [Trichonephila clavipes]|nr:hypothetical protein TNCV_2261501 [Trichonephila clavipes]
MKLEQISVSNVGLLSGREKKREIGMARKRAENREGSLGFPGFVKPVFTKDRVEVKPVMNPQLQATHKLEQSPSLESSASFNRVA